MPEEGARGSKKRFRSENDATPLDVCAGARIMPGSGESSRNVQGVDRAVKIYDDGVAEGELTCSQGCDWASTMSRCEDAVASIAFWGQIATYLSLMEYREGTAIGYLNKLFNLAREHFFPPGMAIVGTGKARDFFVDKGRDGSPTSFLRTDKMSGVLKTLTGRLLHTEWGRAGPQCLSCLQIALSPAHPVLLADAGLSGISGCLVVLCASHGACCFWTHGRDCRHVVG